MNSEKIKEIWKNNVVKQIENYTDAEIEAIILKNARKAIGLSYPGIVFISFAIVLILFFMWIDLKYTPQMRPFWMVCLVILFGCICISIFSHRKMQRYSYDMPLKDWIESRIREFDKSINLKKRYWVAMTFGVAFIILVVYDVFLVLITGFPLSKMIIPFTVGLLSLIVLTKFGNRIIMKRMIKTRKQLQELYDQL